MTRLPSFGLAELPGLPTIGAQVARRGSTRVELLPEEEEGIARKAGRIALGGIAAVGNLLDLPGSMVRDVISGQNPLDQFLTPFTPENRVQSRDILRKAGLIGQKDTWGNLAGSIATDIALDPLTYIFPLGALTKGGQVLKEANLLNKTVGIAAKKLGRPVEQLGTRQAMLNTTVRDVLKTASKEELRAAHNAAKAAGVKLKTIANDPLRGMFATGFLGKVGKVADVGPVSQRVGRTLDQIGLGIRHARIPGTNIEPINALARTFSAPLADTKTRTAQVFARQAFDTKTALHAEARKEVAGYIDELRQTGHATDAEADALREYLESPVTGVAPPELEPLIQKLQARQNSLFEELRQRGVSPKYWASPYARHWPRHMTARLGIPGGAGGASWSTFSGGLSNARRRLWFLQPTEDKFGFTHAIRGETGTIKRILQDPELEQIIAMGGRKNAIASWIGMKYGALVPKEAWVKTSRGLTKFNRHRGIARWIENMDPQLRQAGMYGNHPLVDFQAQLIGAQDAIAASDTVRDLLLSPGIKVYPATFAQERSSVPIKRVLQALRIKPGDHTGGFAMQLADAQGFGNVIRQIGASNAKAAQVELDRLLNFRISRELASDLKRFREPFTSSKPVGELMRGVQSITNLWKGAQTALWPAFHVRNLVSGQYQNYVAGMHSWDSIKETHALLSGKEISGAKDWAISQHLARQRGITNLTDQQATDLIGQLIYAEGLSHRFAGEALSVAGGTNLMPGNISDVMREIPSSGVSHIQPGRMARKFAAREPGTNLKAWRTRGFNDLPSSEFGPMAAGEELAGVVESFNRIAPFLHQIKRGVDPTAAAQKVGAAQVMYQSRYYTKAEQQVLSTLFPFYKFSSRVMPWTLRQLAEKPSGRLGQTLRVANRLRNPSTMTPDYVAETTAIPLGDDPTGGQRYLTGAGLMFEDPLSFLGGGARGALLEAGSRLNPLLKAPLEWGTGQTFFQKGPMGGRSLEDLDPTIGRTLANLTGQREAVKWPGSEGLEFAIANSPLSRATTTARAATYPIRALTDPMMAGQFWPEMGRTATNLLTGARVTTVSPAAQEAMLRERSQKIMRKMGGKTFVRTYIPEEVRADMSPQERKDAEQLQALMNTLANRSKMRAEARKEAEAKAGVER